MGSVSAADVRDALNLTPADIPDSKVLKMVKRAEVTLELELEKQIDYASCTDAEKEAITMLAAIYAICYLSGGTAIGMNFSIGDQYIKVLTNAPSLHVLERQLDKIVSQLKNLYLGVS